MRFENTETFNFNGALRGMRNAKESWDRADSKWVEEQVYDDCDCWAGTRMVYKIGPNDMQLAQTLIKAGPEHRKFMRQIFVCVDITAPIYWWKEFDTYKVGTVSNSTSTMHKLASTNITEDKFEMNDFISIFDNDICKVQKDQTPELFNTWRNLIFTLEGLRQKYIETKDKRYWKELIRLLPESWLQKRTVTMNYENLLGMCSKGQRRFHKLIEWSKDFIDWARTLPYAQELLFIDEVENESIRN